MRDRLGNTMPLFEFFCHECGVTFEDLLPSSESEDPVCESCGEANVERLLSTFSYKIKSSWVTRMERKWGKQGDPYRDEEGKPRPGTKQDVVPHIPGPKTQRKRREMERELKDAVRRGHAPKLPDNFTPGYPDGPPRRKS